MTIAFLLALSALVACLFSSGFQRQRLAHFANSGPDFDISRSLNGDILCEGLIYGPFGRVNTRFVAIMQGHWSDGAGTIREVFNYADGGEHTRNWQITLRGNGQFEATAEDIVGVAKGEQVGAAARLRYKIRLPAESGGHVLSVTDWIYQLENGTLINRSEMRKFGIKVAELVATMRPADGA